MRLTIVLILLLAIGTLACSTPNTAKVLSDMRFGVAEACAVEWLTPDACTYFNDTLNIADALVVQNVPNAGSAVRQTLADAEAKLPATSRLRPYFDVMITLLKP
jgi:hypothetical protein